MRPFTTLCALFLSCMGLLRAGGPRTLFELGGAKVMPTRLSQCVLIIIDAQREYQDGALPLAGVEAAIAETARLLARARKAGTPVIHVVHRGGGGFFTPGRPGFEIVDALRPGAGETVVEKSRVSAFSATTLEAALARTGRKQLLLTGFMTHNCLSSTARAGMDLGYPVTVVAEATATRDLPDGKGGVLPAAALQTASLAALADRTACVVRGEREIQD